MLLPEGLHAFIQPVLKHAGDEDHDLSSLQTYLQHVCISRPGVGVLTESNTSDRSKTRSRLSPVQASQISQT